MNQGSSGFLGSIPPVTRNIIIINVIVWFAQLLLQTRGIDLTNYLGLHYFTSPDFMPHQIITSMFLHATYTASGGIYFTHILFNMFAVFMFGRTIESIWGGKKFLFYYMTTGIGAALIQLLVYFIRVQYLESVIPAEVLSNAMATGSAPSQYAQDIINLLSLTHGTMVGASGAVFGILVAFGMMFPDAKLMIIPIPVPIKAKWFVIGYGLLELTLGFMNRQGDSVAHFAHLGGLLTGLIILLYWRKSNKRYNDKLF